MPGTTDRLLRPLDPQTDHFLGRPDAPVSLVDLEVVERDLGLPPASSAAGTSRVSRSCSSFIAGQAFPVDADFNAAKLAIFAAFLLSAVFGVALLWRSGHPRR